MWRRNLFKLPSGKPAKDFINELTKCLSHYNNASEFQGLALKVYHILSALLLQKQTQKSKAKEHMGRPKPNRGEWMQNIVDGMSGHVDGISVHVDGISLHFFH